MTEPMDVVDGTVPEPEERENQAPRKDPPPTPGEVLEKLEKGVAAVKAAVIPDQKPERLPGVKRTLAEVEGMKAKRERQKPPTPLTPITPRSPGGNLPFIEAEEILGQVPEFGPEHEVQDDGSQPEAHVETAVSIALVKQEAGGAVKPFNRHRAANVLLDAFAMGDEAAAVKWNVKRGTITGYRDRLSQDPEFAKILSLRYAELERSWSVARLQCLRSIIKRIEILAQTSEDIYRLSGAVKVLGELQVVAGVLDGGSQAPQPGAANQEGQGRATRGPGPVFERLDK